MFRTSVTRNVLGRLAPGCLRSVSTRSAAFIYPRLQFGPQLHAVKSRRSYVISTDGQDIANAIDDISNSDYSRISGDYLEQMIDELEQLTETSPEIDCELSQGVLTLTIPTLGSYVINKQPPNKQIWLSSPVSGPKRFDLIGGKWITLRDGSGLTELLQEEISSGLGIDFTFDLDN